MFQVQGPRTTAADVGWVLRTARQHAVDPGLRVGSRLASGLGRLPAVNPSQITRWEQGTTPATSPVVRRYETLCGVPSGHLVAAIDLVHRDAVPRGSTPGLGRPSWDDVVGGALPLLERVMGDDVVTGTDWDELSLLVGRQEHLLMPHRQWRALLDRGLDEMADGVGAPYLHRAEAMARLVGHPRAAAAVVEVVGDALDDPRAPVFAEAVRRLAHADVPDVGGMLSKAMAACDSPDPLRACLSGLAGLLRARRLDPETAVDVAGAALDVCRDLAQPRRVRRSAADVLRTLTDDARGRIATHLSLHPGHDATASVVRSGSPLDATTLTAIRSRVVDLHAADHGVDVEDDERSTGLLDTLLTGSHHRRRADAGRLLALLPHGVAVGRALLDELRSAVRDADPTRVHELLGALTHVAPGDDLRLLVDLAVREVVVGTGDEAAVEASHVIGSVTCSPEVAAAVSTRVHRADAEARTGGRPASPALLDGWAGVLRRQAREGAALVRS